MNKNTIKKVFLAGVFITIALGIFSPNYSAAVSCLTIDPDAENDVKINATVMEVNTLKSYMIVGEKRIDISGFKKGDKACKTSLLDKKGNAVQLNAFKKGQRVLVKGYELPEGAALAEIIQQVPDSEKGNRR